MSTMYEALRKAEAGQKKASLFSEAPLAAPSTKASPAAAPVHVQVILGIAVAVVWIWLGMNYFQGQKQHQQAAVKRAAVVKAAAAAPTVPVAVAPKHPPGTYGLDGIIFAGENSMAVINGKVLPVGGKIGPLTVQTITSDQVEVLDARNGAVQVLRPE